MKIALNMGTLRGFGSAQIGRSFLGSLADVEDLHQFYALVPESWNIQASNNVELHAVGAGLYQKVLTDQIRCRRVTYQRRCSRLFSLTDTSIVGGGIPHLLLVHQPYLAASEKELTFLSQRLRYRYAFMRAYFRLGISSVSMFTVQTEFMRQRLVASWRIPYEQIRVIPSAIEDLGKPALRWNPECADPPYIVYAAGPSPHKNHGIFIDLLTTVRSRGSRVIAKLTVEADQVPALQARAQASGVDRDIEYLGAKTTSEVRHLLAGATAAVIPSRLESFGLTYLEAMYVGTPVIAADRPFAREACGEAAVYCSVDGGSEYGEAVVQLVEDATIARRLSVAGKRRFREIGLSWAEVRDAYLDVLSKLDA